MAETVVLDTNVFVAAGFNPQSASARILERVRSGDLQMTWHESTRGETKHVLLKIPSLSWAAVECLFHESNRYEGELAIGEFRIIGDRDDRKYAALSAATGATLVSSDSDLLRTDLTIQVLTPSEFCSRLDD